MCNTQPRHIAHWYNTSRSYPLAEPHAEHPNLVILGINPGCVETLSRQASSIMPAKGPVENGETGAFSARFRGM